MWRNTLVVRNEEKLQRCLEDLQKIRLAADEDLAINSPLDMRGAIEIENMLQVSEIIVHSALLRTESRGSHYREDFPKLDDENWGKSIIVNQTEENTIRLIPEKLPQINK